MEMPALLRELEGKTLSDRELGRYFDTKSPDDLLLTLRRLKRDGLIQFEVMLSNEYFDRQKARIDVILRTDILKPVDAFDGLQRDTYGITVKSDTPLIESEIIDVIRKLPPEMAERYLQFRLSAINKKLYDYIATQHKKRGGDEDEFYDRVEHDGLVVEGVEASYNNEPIYGLGFQHRQALRLLIKKKGKLCYKDEFTDAEAGIFNSNPTDHTLRNLIYEVRRALRAVAKTDCIKNTPGEGWSLKLEA